MFDWQILFIIWQTAYDIILKYILLYLSLGILMLSQFATISKYANGFTIVFVCMLVMVASLSFLASDAYKQIKVESESPFQDYYLYIAFLVVLGGGYPMAHNALLGILSSQMRAHKLVSSISTDPLLSSGSTLSSSRGAILNGWFVFFGDAAKSVFPLAAGYILVDSQRYYVIFAGTALLLLSAVIGMVINRGLLES